MKFLIFNTTLVLWLILTATKLLPAQSLSFSTPGQVLPTARTDKAVDMTNFKGRFFITWKAAGATGNIHIGYLGKQYDTSFSQRESIIGTEKSAFAPVLSIVGDHLYILWLGMDGSLKYIVNDSDTSFNTQAIYTVNFENALKLRSGITTTGINGRLMIASHADNKNEMVVAEIDVDNKGLLKPSVLQSIPGKKSDEYPFIVTLSDKAVRISYKDYNDQGIYYADFNLDSKTWTKQLPISKSKTKVSPSIYHGFNTSRLFYIWKGDKKDNRIYYATDEVQNSPAVVQLLPDYFKTAYPVSICNVDEKRFILVFIGEDQKLYLSYFTNYNPASWMADVLFPAKENLTLKDIVIPGAHDAGMSALNGTGGSQSGSINPCNTLTQQLNIGQQLNEGIRMFDLRVGSFKSNIYTKHSSSDCMSEAVGGGYGERFSDILDSIKTFLNRNNKEFVILTFSHFCPNEASAETVADSIFSVLGKKYLYNNPSQSIGQVKLKDLAGRVIVNFEGYANADKLIDSNTMSDKSNSFLNIRRAYAATNQIKNLLAKEVLFFTSMKDGINNNDLVRLDWQLTQSSEEAALVCNDFQDEKVSPVLSGMMLLTNVVKKNRSIIDLAGFGNKYLAAKINEWISSGVINRKNKPNILYIDVAGAWITDYCVDLNEMSVYN